MCFILAQFKGLLGQTTHSLLTAAVLYLDIIVHHQVLLLGHQPLPLGPGFAVDTAHGVMVSPSLPAPD